MAFQDDIKKALEYYGYDTMVTGALPNILADISAEYNDNPALKNILKSFFNEGNGKIVFALQSTKPTQRQLKLKKLGDHLAKKYGFAFSLIDYVISCISYGMGWSNTVTQPTTTPVQVNSNIPSSVSLNLQETLDGLKMEYLYWLATLYTKPVYKRFYVQPGYFSAEALSKLRLIEGKINITANALGINEDDWCNQQMQSFLAAKNKKGANKKRTINRLVKPLASLVIVVIIWGLIRVSKLNRAAYEEEYQAIIELISEKNYANAIDGIVELNDKYGGKIGALSARDKANAQVPSLIDAYVEQLIDEGDYEIAISWLNNIKERFESESAIQAFISNKIADLSKEEANIPDDKIMDLLRRIKINNGHLDNEGKEKLKKLLKADPDNYWLKFIASKEL